MLLSVIPNRYVISFFLHEYQQQLGQAVNDGLYRKWFINIRTVNIINISQFR